LVVSGSVWRKVRLPQPLPEAVSKGGWRATTDDDEHYVYAIAL